MAFGKKHKSNKNKTISSIELAERKMWSDKTIKENKKVEGEIWDTPELLLGKKTGNKWCRSSLKIADGEYLNIRAFDNSKGKIATDVAQLPKGSIIKVIGTLKSSIRDKNGIEEKMGIYLIIDKFKIIKTGENDLLNNKISMPANWTRPLIERNKDPAYIANELISLIGLSIESGETDIEILLEEWRSKKNNRIGN